MSDRPGADGASERSPFRRVAVAGCGLVGGSVALAAASVAGVERVTVTDASTDVRRAARARLAGIDVADSTEEAFAGTDLVVVATPVDAIADVVLAALEVAPGAVVTDVGSVKGEVIAELESRWGDGSGSYVGGHPMAGSEVEGLAGADASLFQGSPWVLTPTSRSTDEAFGRLAAFLRLLGARVVAVDPVTHDRLVAIVSHLPQLLASALMRFAGEAAESDPSLLLLAGGGFRDMTRVAGSNPSLWRGIVRENRAAVGDALLAFEEAVGDVRDAVARADWDAVEALVAGGREARRRLPGKEVAGRTVDLVVPVADRPAALADVATALGAAGINIEDLSMRHAEEAGRGALVVAVAGEDAAERARAVLAARGIPSHVEPH